MDEYTFKTMTWLNRRYRKTDLDGIYIAHQPIYGFHDNHSEPNVLERYNRAFQILKAISHLDVHSLVDVGASEGFIASLIRDHQGVDVTCTDISEEACNRARDIFHHKAFPADARALPFQDDQFDAALCSETLEHIVDYSKALDELLRVARKAVIITVPHERPEQVTVNREQGELHAHINAFERNQFDYLLSKGFQIISHQFQSQYIYHPSNFIEHSRTVINHRFRSFLVEQMAGALLNFDSWVSEMVGVSYALLFVIIKDRSIIRKHSLNKVKIYDILEARVPYLFLTAKTRP
jgi:ubiquinone/menaquinone biosynthesis C-methylase UbiE